MRKVGKPLTLNLKREYFEAIRATEKLEEYRTYKESTGGNV